MREGLTQRRCPKCGGNLFLCSDHYGWYEQCLQCSCIGYLDSIVESRDKISKTSLKESRHVIASSNSK